MKLYTKRGDQGQTDLFGGKRASKSHPRVGAYGAVDGANSAIGYVYCLKETGALPREIVENLPIIMSDLFDLGAELATAETSKAKQLLEQRLSSHITQERIRWLENCIDQADAQLPPLKTFLLPTGCEAAGRLHLARSATREAERAVALLQTQGEEPRPELVAYINRLSDLLFVWARLCNHCSQTEEQPWIAK